MNPSVDGPVGDLDDPVLSQEAKLVSGPDLRRHGNAIGRQPGETPEHRLDLGRQRDGGRGEGGYAVQRLAVAPPDGRAQQCVDARRPLLGPCVCDECPERGERDSGVTDQRADRLPGRSVRDHGLEPSGDLVRADSVELDGVMLSDHQAPVAVRGGDQHELLVLRVRRREKPLDLLGVPVGVVDDQTPRRRCVRQQFGNDRRVALDVRRVQISRGDAALGCRDQSERGSDRAE
ncbi:MAG: hypothetical protein ITG02_10865 [Patulibacter sp.]|nr:hypothetical protein [Patulibacter sp.]